MQFLIIEKSGDNYIKTGVDNLVSVLVLICYYISMEVNNISPEPVESSNIKLIPVLIGILILIIVIGGSFLLYQPKDKSDAPFNIPIDTDHVIFFEGNTLYALEPNTEKVKKLGSFQLDGEVTDVTISANLKSIAFVSDRTISHYTSFSDGGVLAEHGESIENIAVFDEIIFFSSGDLDERNERQIYNLTDGIIKPFIPGRTPFFLRTTGIKINVGTLGGFKMFDLNHGDFLDSEVSSAPIANDVQESRSGEKLALLSGDSVYVYSVLSDRPLHILEDYSVSVPGLYDVAVSDHGLIASLVSSDDGTSLFVHDTNEKGSEVSEVVVGEDAKILIWSK